MSKKSDDSIDRIFRQALTQYDTKFHEDDWLKMEKLLNEEALRKAAARSRRIKGTAYTLTGLTGLFIVVYFLANNNPSGPIANLSDSVTEMQASEALTENGNVKLENPSEGLLSHSSPDTSIQKQTQRDPSDEANVLKNRHSEETAKSGDHPNKSPEIAGKKAAIGKKGTDSDSSIENGQGAAFRNRDVPTNQNALDPLKSSPNRNEDADKPGLDPSNKSNPSLTLPEETSNVEAVDDKLSKTSNGSEQTILQATSGESGEGTFNDVRVVDQDSEQVQKASHEPISNASTSLSTDSLSNADVSSDRILADSLSSQGVAPSKEKSKLKSHWSVAFVIAPEFSTTTLSSYSSPGDSYGLRIGYQLSNRLSVNTGLIRSQKKYEGSGEGYKPRNPAYWQIRTNGVVPNEIFSKCLVYELPIGIQFDAIQTSKSRLFVSAAMSSYFMISQAYDYTFESPNPGADTGWRSRGSESYWFSVGMVSAGYERYITRSFAIGIEPYLKMSLAEIGWPNIKLYSTGAYVTLRYKFMSSRNSN